MFLGEIFNVEGKVRIALVLGPGSVETRRRIYARFQQDQMFKTTKKQFTPKWTRVWSSTLLLYDETEVSPEDVIELLKPKLRNFLDEKLPKVTSILQDALRADAST